MSDHLSSSDEDLEEILNLTEVPKNTGYFEETVPSYDEQQYKEHFRINKQIVVDLAEQFENSEYYNYQEGNSPKISALKFVTVFLWFIGNEAASFRDVADRFGISKSSLFKIVRRVTYFLSNMSRDIIKWPTANEKVQIERHFRQNNFPSVIGIIDGTHVRIDKPAEDPDSYLNRKHYHSIQVQIVCDHQRKIRDIFVGYPGSVHDSRVLRTSPLYQTFPEKCEDFFILGDSGYPCLKNLLTPFKDRGQLTRRQRNYNYLLSKNRYIIEHTFGLMKQRFRQLHHLKLKSIRDIVHFIRACAVLHNIALNDDFINEENEPQENEQEFEEHEEPGPGLENEDDVNGIRIRNTVMNDLPFVL